ncbi:diguanylate cyclase [Ancylobacter novellus DSM 506]|uniref:diguanylate cyclase n=1 Tax=Ancylobacter novellus (strain ATCC 8093 / DSM 506 / JCM 20403 / CCM 1077 / IAM 12100 / NBRC 12443 / NCIMB 10456) TaxID=639283 RepID=D7A1G1_ANCN5|nr:GGDEF domain-containing protein [Ancylobacter novellus]ADH89519.1 diguanylate cyclase [Ancylobacter novellus DSM 506]
MSFDPLTLWSVVLLVVLMLAAIMALVWLLTPEETALLHWAAFCTVFVIGLAGVMSRGLVPDFVSVQLANAAVFVGYGLVWTGLRAFDRRRPRLVYAFIAPAVWIALCQLPFFRDSIVHRIQLSSVIVVVLLFLCISQVWKGWVTPSRMRGLLLGLLTLSLTMTVLRAPFATFMVDDNRLILFSNPRLAWIGLFAMLLLICVGFTLVLLVRERVELRYRSAAQHDELTGLFNRRGFMEEAVPASRKGGPMALMVLDLDRFKQVNDQFGHAAGDRVLVLFAEVLLLELRPGDVAARIGGEEFAALLPDVRPETARQIAERIRGSFRQELNRLKLGAGTLECSVSIGLALGAAPQGPAREEIEAAILRNMARADAALYEAKAQGRNRIEVAAIVAEDRPAA